MYNFKFVLEDKDYIEFNKFYLSNIPSVASGMCLPCVFVLL